ncbi:PP2C family protein-serine/threonine phosphatase [Murdochiella vaginalis]|uniref:PP2C family protein-serine/threonine phosphatase n=1 Tax=Murdochiella vaginalis TaxID=1852373 RepID=UPI0008FE280E|nr:SpoIIE family protein phosphatase [Murdochiella vaginalis]
MKNTTRKEQTFLTDTTILNAMEDYVRVVDRKGRILFENEALLRFNQVESKGKPVFPLSTATGPFLEHTVTRTEFCVAGHVFSVMNSPIYEEGEVVAAIQVFRDTTIQNNITVQLLNRNRKWQKEIALARTIQTKMLPRIKTFGPLEFDFAYMPSEELSGDFFDFVPLGKGRLGFYISDVVGHGVSASILTMFVRQTMRSILEEEQIREPAQVLRALRDRFFEIQMDDGQYFSLFYAVFDTVENTLTYANAGHHCLPMVECDGKLDVLYATGRLISPVLLEEYTYVQQVRPMRKNERFLFFTDGAVEAKNALGMEYGEENLRRLLLTTKNNTLPTIVHDLRQYTGEQLKDDIAIVYVENRRRKA